jgi:HSP20 family molecular chaperone IbpA
LVKPEDITAEYADGVLTVSMPAATLGGATEDPRHAPELPVE